ncbi:MAG: iron ABC transporter substrate-binding protein, partial [Paludibacteraceae bacterium]|nr:iron ABC transporter substrate-binding protein [Paludibacteraceae bacterium]
RLKYFKPIKENKVYNFNKRCTSTGGNDYWETAIARPDILLKDIISVIHPEILDHYEPFFINAVE